MMDHKSDGTSESEEMYLLTIARMSERGEAGPVPITNIAERLGLRPVSVHQMIRKLEDNNLVRYFPYKGVLLTSRGESIANTYLRFHRLWEVFLTRHLGFSMEEASEIACDLEHASTEELAARLDQYLEQPRRSPSGKSIPDSIPAKEQLTLLEVPVGRSAVVTRVDATDAVSAFLSSEGIIRGAEVMLLGTGSGGDVLLDVKGHSVHLGEQVAAGIHLRAADVIKMAAAGSSGKL